MAIDTKKEQERDELHRAIWAIADELRGAVDGWDFKNYVLGTMFYRYISENLTNYVIEFQHSPISAEEFDERNKFYTSIGKKVVWIFDVQEKYETGRLLRVKPRYEHDGKYVASDGKWHNRWIVNEYRVGYTFCGGAMPDDENCWSVGYEYERNEKYAKQQTHEWHWKRPLNSFSHFYPPASPDIIVFFEFAPECLQKVIWCKEVIDGYEADATSERIHDWGDTLVPTTSLYLDFREDFVIKSDFRYFTATEYTVKQFLSAIRDRIL